MSSACLPIWYPSFDTALTSQAVAPGFVRSRSGVAADSVAGTIRRGGLIGGTDQSLQPLRDLVFEILDHAVEATASEEAAVLLEPSTVEYAVRFALFLPAMATPPDVFVDDDGEFRFEWDFGPRRVLAIAVGRDGTLNLAGLYGHESSHGDYTLGEELPPEVLTALRRVGALGDRSA